MAEVVRTRVRVRGSVQGVFFRDSCRDEAGARGVAGSVQNRSDGSVEAVFEGPRDAVSAMVEWCRHGPSSANVDDVQTTDETPEGDSGFVVT